MKTSKLEKMTAVVKTLNPSGYKMGDLFTLTVGNDSTTYDTREYYAGRGAKYNSTVKHGRVFEKISETALNKAYAIIAKNTRDNKKAAIEREKRMKKQAIINEAIRLAEEHNFEKLKQKKYAEYMANIEAIEVVTNENWHVSTMVRWEPVAISESTFRNMVVKKVYEEYYCSPSGSEYMRLANGDILRNANHWGSVASCYWPLAGKDTGAYQTAVANIEDFKKISYL